MEQTQVCRVCGRTLPLSKFERFRTGTYRKVCNQCKWVMYIKPCIERKRHR
ncbi:MAG: hypothetical protein IJM78_07065 [Prevotella sp.]|nr:hypothetical protein [Prevotella sp.]